LVEGALFGQPLRGETPTSIPTSPIRLHIPFRPGLSLLDVLEQVGGPTPYAETERSYVRRAESGERLPLPDLLDIWDSQDVTRDVLLNPDDRIIVPIMRLEVAVAGQVNSPTTVPFQEGQTVGDYVTLAGGVNAEDGSVNRIFFLDVRGRRTPTNFDSIVPPGSTIFVGRNAWAQTRQTVGNVLIVTGWISTIATFLSQVFGISVADLISQ
jgi:protein involved in polysaccharide export with SLBB domain